MRKSLQKFMTAALLTTAIGVSSSASAGETFGVASGQWIFVSAHEFQQSDPDCAWQYVSSGYYEIASAPGGSCPATTVVRAGIELPEGAAIDFQRLYYYNTAATNLTTFLTSWNVENFSGLSPSFVEHSADTTTAATGYGAKQFNFSPLVVFDTYDTTVSPARQRSYGFAVNMPTGTTTRLKGVAIGFTRQIAPAPASASFIDVPTSHPFFNEVEQMRKSGVTLGCGGGQYCPDQVVTRGQMAAFLTRAMGLHWDWATNAP